MEMLQELRERLEADLPPRALRTRYYDGRGGVYHAIQLPWSLVTAILGRPHEGNGDDQVLVQALLQAGAPEWVRDAEGWVDEHGWGLIGPALEKQPVTVRIPAPEAIRHMRWEHEEPAWLVVRPDGQHEWRWGRQPPTPPGGWVIRGPIWAWDPEDGPEPEGVALEMAQLEAARNWSAEVEEAESGLRVEIVGGDEQ